MSDITRVKSDTKRAEPMSEVAVLEAREMLETLMKREHRGPTDTWTAARDRTAKRVGIAPSQAMRLGIAGDDYTGQEKAVFTIVDWAIKNSVHVHLVAHARKSERGQGAPETEDIKGAMEIGANAFNILTVWRDRKREEEAKKPHEETEGEDRPGVILNVAKQRNGDFEGKVGLWFDQETYRYHGTPDRTNWDRRYVQRGTSIGEAA